jgi:hypothetical protein
MAKPGMGMEYQPKANITGGMGVIRAVAYIRVSNAEQEERAKA